MLAVRIPGLACAVPFYGGQLDAEDVPKIKAPLLLHYAGLDERVNAGWPAFEAALKANGIQYTAYMYEGHSDYSQRKAPNGSSLEALLAGR
jgi:carboxymethylenebutenolidase